MLGAASKAKQAAKSMGSFGVRRERSGGTGLVRAAASLRFGAVVALALMALPMAARAQGRDCPAAPDADIRLDVEASAPAIDRDRTMAALREISGAVEHKNALGLYAAKMRARLEVQFRYQRRGGTACLWVQGATIAVELGERTIYLARELARDDCRARVTLAHEREHARIDDRILDRHLPQVRRAVAQAIARIGVVGPIDAREIEAEQARIGAELERAFRQQMANLEKQRERDQAAIDTPESYRKIAGQCR